MSDDERHDDGALPDEMRDLLGAYVLDALDDDERARVEALLEVDRRARTEVDRLSQVADALAGEVPEAEPPAGLWERIAAEAPVRRPRPVSPDEPTPAVPSTTPVYRDEPMAAPSAVPVHPDELGARRTGRRQPSKVVGALLAAAAAIVVVALGATVLSRGDDDPASYAEQLELQADEIADAADARTATLTGVDSTGTVDVVIDAEGRAIVTPDGLPPLTSDATYQLWAVGGRAPVSLALLGADPSITAVQVGGQPAALAVSVEPSTGSTAPTTDPVVVGDID